MSRPEPQRNLADAALTEAVLASFAGAPSPRVRQITQSLVRHLHAFVEEVAPTEDEWFAGIGFLTRAGHITTGTRQEFVLLSDVLGVSMLVIGQNHRPRDGATESTVFGPFFPVAGAGCAARPTAGSGSGRCSPSPIPSPPTALPATCSGPAGATRCARPMSTSASPRPGARR